jgi:hypothetical protein
VKTCVIVGCFDPIDLGDFEERDLAGVFDCEALEFSGDIFAESDFLSGAFESEVESRVVEWLEEIVESSGLEGAQGVLIVGCDEDNGGRDIVAEKFEYVEAVALWHLDVEEEKIGFVGANFREGVYAGGAFSDDFDIGIETEEDGEIASCERFVVDDDGGEPDGVFFRLHRATPLSVRTDL